MMDDLEFRRLLERLDLSWKGYARVRSGVKKRIRRHMKERRIATLEAYLEKIEGNGEFKKEVERRASVSISRFFRDADLWKAMAEDVIPSLKAACPERIRVWSAGCAMGQEVYTLRIVWMLQDKQHPVLPDLEIWATDLDAGILEKAREGIYPAGSMRGVPEEIRNSSFIPLSVGRWMVREEVKRGILWERHDFFREPVRGAFDVLFLRNNLFTYYPAPIGLTTLVRVIESLKEGGFLVIGRREKIPPGIDVLIPFGSCGYVYKKGISGK